MRANFVSIFILFVVIAAAAGSVIGQSAFAESALNEGYRMMEIGKALTAMPNQAKRAEDFIPPHWKLFTRADGDLNKDGQKETVMVLQLDDNDKSYVNRLPGAKSIDEWAPNTFMIVLVRPLPSNSLAFESVNYSIGSLPQDQRDEFTVDIKNGVLIIHVSTGGMQRFDETYRFRDGSLIGYDYKTSPVTIQSDTETYALSENYLTGERTETTTTFNKKDTGVDSVKKSTFKTRKTEFSETYSHCH
jgi:hypothetical protein